TEQIQPPDESSDLLSLCFVLRHAAKPACQSTQHSGQPPTNYDPPRRHCVPAETCNSPASRSTTCSPTTSTGEWWQVMHGSARGNRPHTPVLTESAEPQRGQAPSNR